MKQLALGALLGVLVVLFGLPLAVPAVVVSSMLQPVTIAFAAGILARPHVTRRRWSR